jgi:BirA family biotin operon repressor/biotin-[acetyl-CoA-carboxylase] ligase
VEAMVIGFGVNVNSSLKYIPENIQVTASSLYLESGSKIQLVEFIANFLNIFERTYISLNRQNFNGVVEQWKKNCDQFGKVIDVQLKNRNQEAFFEDISSEGHLIYRLHSGKVGKLISGDIIAY